MRYERSIRGTTGSISAIAHSCAACGGDVPAGARFCASCGARLRSTGGGVSWSIADKRYFGALRPGGIGRAAGVRLGRLWAMTLGRLRLALTTVSVRSAAAIARLQLRWAAKRLERERGRLLHALGEAVYRDDQERASEIRGHVGDVDRHLEAVKDELRRVEREADDLIRQARMEGGPTNVVQPDPDPAPGPEVVPEPQPEPHEPPGPVIVPEPEPVPHEPPGPVIVPEPTPPTGE
jgi:hypothetical protein